MEPTCKIELTNDEASALLQLIHLAVQARGLEVAEAGVVLQKKISAAVEAAKQTNKEAA